VVFWIRNRDKTSLSYLDRFFKGNRPWMSHRHALLDPTGNAFISTLKEAAVDGALCLRNACDISSAFALNQNNDTVPKWQPGPVSDLSPTFGRLRALTSFASAP
jgi:hypothetical protein